MKKILMALLLLTASIYADLSKDGSNAYIHGNFKKAKRLWEKAASQGDAQAEYNLGVLYTNGQGVRQSDDEAFRWYQKAANQGMA